MENECGNIPTHDKNSQCNSRKGGAQYIHRTQVFGSKKKCICAKGFQEAAINSTCEDEPKQQQHLELPEMKNKKLHREGIIYVVDQLLRHTWLNKPVD